MRLGNQAGKTNIYFLCGRLYWLSNNRLLKFPVALSCVTLTSQQCASCKSRPQSRSRRSQHLRFCILLERELSSQVRVALECHSLSLSYRATPARLDTLLIFGSLDIF